MKKNMTSLILMLMIVFASKSVYSQIETKLTASDGEADDAYGRFVDICGEYAVVGASNDDNENGIDAGAAYVFKRNGDSWTEQQKLIASDGAASDLFGYSVGINGDYIIIGACWDDDHGEKSGSMYVFERDGVNWIEQQKLTASDAGEDDRFGISAAISGDYVVVGAFFDDDYGYRSGSAYIFQHNGSSWIEQAKLTASDAAESDWFGVSVSIDGDYAVVGSRYDDNDNGLDAGAAYIFKREGTNWIEQVKLIASDGAQGDLFHKNTINGDYVVVGAYHDDDNGDNSGSFYVFKREGTDWIEQAKLTASDGAAGDLFGAHVAINGSRIVVGAYDDDDNGDDSGSVYVFKRTGADWNEELKITASDGAEGDIFGIPVAIDQNYIMVGARQDDDNGFNSGSAYIYELQYLPMTLHVPGDYAAITEAMAAANYSDTVLVAPGTYPESFALQAGVILKSEAGPMETIIARNGVPELITGAQDAVIKGFTVADNDNGEGFPGNGIYSDGDNLTICYCIIRNNRGGIYLNNNSQAIVYNNTIDNNSLNGIYMQIEPSPEIYNNIITNNLRSGIFRNTAHSLGDPFIQYNCYYGNSADYGYYGNPWSPEPGAGELFENPLFVGGAPLDYHLKQGSPCIDNGDPSSPVDPDGTRADLGALYYDQSTGVDLKHTIDKPLDFCLYPAYPNPFNPATTIKYNLSKSIKVNISIYNMLGQIVKVFEYKTQQAGSFSLQWDGKDEHDVLLTSGIYICRMQAGNFRQSIKLMLVR